MGIMPNIMVLRCDKHIDEAVYKKIALFCNVKRDCVFENITVPILYEAPMMLENQGFSDIVCRELGIEAPEPDMKEWKDMLERIENRRHKVTIGLVGKYVQLHDAYLSVAEALRHAGYSHSAFVDIKWIDSETITEQNVCEKLSQCQGVIVPGGFGNRGIEGKIVTAKYCRENNVPYLGICLGMQTAVIEFARHVAGMDGANSGEFNPEAAYKVIDFLPDQNDSVNKGGTLRLGAYPCKITEGTQMYRCYGSREISERHRHRYEFNNQYREALKNAGLTISGTSPDGYIVETVEVEGNDFFIGVQYHPEFKSRPNRPHPLFIGLVGAAMKRSCGEGQKN
jgi:CTP synthase